MAGIAQNGKKLLILIVVLQVRTKMIEKGKREKMGMHRSKENTLIYIHIFIYTHPRIYKHI